MIQLSPDTLDELEALAKRMDEKQQRVFQIYVALGAGRTLRQLGEQCVKAGIEVTVASIRRWSYKFKWEKLAQRTQAEISSRIAAEMLPLQVARSAADLKAISALKERFYTRLKIDPLDCTEDELARAIDPDLKDYLDILRLEQQIIGHSPFDPAATAGPDVGKRALPEADKLLAKIVREAAQARYNLPADDVTEPPDA